MEHDIPFGNSNRENGPTFLDFPLFLGIFQWDEPIKRVPFTAEPEIQGFLWVICKWRIVLYSSTWNFIITINIITSIGQYSLGIPWGSCLNVWFLAYDYWLPTTKETLIPINKVPRGLNSILLFLCLWWRYLQRDPNHFAGTTSRASKPSFFSADVELHVPAQQRGKFGIL